MAGTTGRPVCGTWGRVSRQRALSVVCVLGCEPAVCPALPSLRQACRHLRAHLHALSFGTLALGDTDALDCFYNAGEDGTRAADAGVSVTLLFLLGSTKNINILFPRHLFSGASLFAFLPPPVYVPGWLDFCRGVGV